MSNPPRHPPSDPNDETRTGGGDDFDIAPDRTPRVAPIVASPDDETRRLADLRERVYATMLKRHTLEPKVAWGLILAGAAILFFVGLIFALFMLIVSAILFDEGPGFQAWLIVYLIALVPLLIWQERRTRGGFFTLAQPDVDLTRDPDNVGDYLLNRSKANATAIVDGFMWAPRAIVAGFRAVRGVRETGLDRVLPEAADLLTLLLSLDGGVKIKDLAPPGEDAMQLMPTLKWLDAHDYIGTSTRGDRVWVSTFAKKRLTADHGDKVTFQTSRK
jgi:hypothetical protein